MPKHCRKCDTIYSIDNFYRAGNGHQSLCKTCCKLISSANYEKTKQPCKLRGFDALPEDRQNQIKEDIKTMTSKEAALKNGINYRTFLLWKRKFELPSKD